MNNYYTKTDLFFFFLIKLFVVELNFFMKRSPDYKVKFHAQLQAHQFFQCKSEYLKSDHFSGQIYYNEQSLKYCKSFLIPHRAVLYTVKSLRINSNHLIWSKTQIDVVTLKRLFVQLVFYNHIRKLH